MLNFHLCNVHSVASRNADNVLSGARGNEHYKLASNRHNVSSQKSHKYCARNDVLIQFLLYA